MANHRSEALDQLRRVEQSRARINELYRDGNGAPHMVAPLHQGIGDALKLAEVNAILAVADELRDLRDYFEGRPC